MLVVDNGDAIRGVAEVATKLDFIVNGYVGTTATQLADGQLGTSEADLYLSGANATIVTSITIVNTDSAARTFTLYLKPSGGTSRAISPVSLDLGIGFSFYTDGQRMVVMNKTGEVVTSQSTHAVAHQNGGGDEISVVGLSGLLADDQHVLDAEAVSAVEAAGLTFAEDKGITLDISLADGSWNAILQVGGTAGEDVDYGEVVYLDVNDTKWNLAQGDAEATVAPMTGIVCVAGDEDAAITILIIGSIRADAAFPALTVAAPVFIDPDTAGDVSSTELTTGEYQKALGWSPDANTVVLTGNPDWVKVG